MTTTGRPGRGGGGSVPASSGPAAALVSLRVTAAPTAAPGATIAATVVADVRADGPRILTVPAASRLLVTRGTTVVGTSGPGTGPAAVPMVLRAGATRPAQAVPASVTLVGCSEVSGGASGAPLPAGTYGVVAVLAYGQDSLQNAADGSGRQFALVSAPWTIAVR